jgi:hypothetical protein
MLSLLTNWRGLKTARSKQLEDIQDGVLTRFQQASSHPKLRCRYCGMKGHVSEVCYKRLDDEEKKRIAGNSVGTSNTQGWFDDPDDGKDVSSFQYCMGRPVLGFRMIRHAWLGLVSWLVG